MCGSGTRRLSSELKEPLSRDCVGRFGWNLHGKTARSALYLTVKVAGGGTSVHACAVFLRGKSRSVTFRAIPRKRLPWVAPSCVNSPKPRPTRDATGRARVRKYGTSRALMIERTILPDGYCADLCTDRACFSSRRSKAPSLAIRAASRARPVGAQLLDHPLRCCSSSGSAAVSLAFPAGAGGAPTGRGIPSLTMTSAHAAHTSGSSCRAMRSR